ncbi:MAG TPA: hypothetical protein VFE78_31270, partial [Gemmataceae bacterium]|nr:hypothetical protein [Gemmataceae bacterium]
MTPQPFWLAALALALPFAAPAARAAEADRPSVPKCLAHAKALCSSHHPVGLALDVVSSLVWSEDCEEDYCSAALLPGWLKVACCGAGWSVGPPIVKLSPAHPATACYSAPGACPAGCATPACACVPAGSPMPCWNADTCWRQAVMPPPVPMTAPMPCAALPMPHPMTGAFPGTTPACAPMPVCAEPMPVYAPCCAAPAPAPAHYVVETKLMRSNAGGAV